MALLTAGKYNFTKKVCSLPIKPFVMQLSIAGKTGISSDRRRSNVCLRCHREQHLFEGRVNASHSVHDCFVNITANDINGLAWNSRGGENQNKARKEWKLLINDFDCVHVSSVELKTEMIESDKMSLRWNLLCKKEIGVCVCGGGPALYKGGWNDSFQSLGRGSTF